MTTDCYKKKENKNNTQTECDKMSGWSSFLLFSAAEVDIQPLTVLGMIFKAA